MTGPVTLDCIVIGGGAAGLTAAVYLGRYRRRAVVLDAGASRLAMIPHTRNVPGFPDGIAGKDLLARMRQQAARFGVAREDASVGQLEKDGDAFVAREGARSWRAPTVLLATGARDVAPDIEGLDAGLSQGQVRYCPVCDGYETQGQRVAVLGRGGHGLREAMFVAGFDNAVTWLSMESQRDVEPPELAALRARGIRIAEQLPRTIRCAPGTGVVVTLADGSELAFDVLYPALGMHHASELATRLGAGVQPDGQLLVDAHMQTTVPGLYAAGDVAVDLNQISVAAGHAAIAATAIHNRLGAQG
jgi:thioredoxin reductase (NADPH)